MEKILEFASTIEKMNDLYGNISSAIHSFFLTYFIIATLVYLAATIIWIRAMNGQGVRFKGEATPGFKPEFKIHFNLSLIIQLTLYIFSIKMIL